MSAKFYVYRTDKSENADEVAKELGAKRIGNNWPSKVELKSGDVVVNWGAQIQDAPRGVKILNKTPLLDKFTQVGELVKAGVATITAVRKLEAWIHRANMHEDGNDLRDNPPSHGGFWVRREPIVKEFRVHSFDGKSIRAGVKEPASSSAHPWIRTYTHGWRINCNHFRSTAEMRDIAHAACRALKLEFGAVDIGQREDGSLLVIEVNTAPGIETDTQPASAYADAVREWSRK